MLLEHLGARRLIITGFRSDSCIPFTAADAHMPNYGMLVPEGCTAALDAGQNRHALALLRQSLHADIDPATTLELHTLLQG